MRAPGMFEEFPDSASARSTVWLIRPALSEPEFRRRNLIGPGDMPWAVGTESAPPDHLRQRDLPLVLAQALQEFG
jgi:hypothetical protein